MTDSLRDRIAAVIEKERNQWAGGDAASEVLADAVIAALGSDCIYRYACANCGDFWFDKSERMQRFALLHSRLHQTKDEHDNDKRLFKDGVWGCGQSDCKACY